jgi:putative ABC transport system permease protein
VIDVDPGFEAGGLLTMEIDVSGTRYEEEAALRQFYDGVLERVAALPGVTGAAVVSQLPLGGNLDRFGVHTQLHPSANPEQDPYADRYAVSPGFLQVMHIPLRRGRPLDETDRADAAPVILINETLARVAFPGADPIGQRVKVGGLDGPWRTVVGVVGDVRHTGLDVSAGPQIYLPRAQWVDGDMALVVRAADPARLAGPVRAAIASVDPDQPVLRVATMPSVVAASTASRRFLAGLLGAFALLATLLASVGIFGVISGFVGERTREIGIRLALGSERSAIARLVSGETLRLTLLGVALGLGGTLVLGRLLRSQLFGVGPHDPLALALSSATIVGVAMAAALAPARRAMAVDPMTALRTD